MSFACGKKKVKQKLAKNELALLKEKFHFNENEILEFQRRFLNLTKSNKFLDKDTFRENMGLLGLDSGSFLADRIFAALDVDKDGYIRLEEYLKYFDILIYGSPEDKHHLTFRMIDVDAKGFFTYDEFKDMILSMLYTWNNLTGSHYNIGHNQKLETFLTNIFQRFDIEDKGRVTAQNFATVVAKDPELLDIFNHFNQGIIESVQPNTELDQKDQNIINDLEQLYGKLNQLRIFVNGKADALELPQDDVAENKADYLKPDSLSPRAELKTPIVSNLDSLIRRTIFFQAFKEDLQIDRRASLRPLRQQSDIGNRAVTQRTMSRDNSDYQRRWSHQPNGQTQARDFRKHDDGETDANGNRLFDKFKSADVYQEGNSLQSLPPQQREAHFSTFRKEKIEEEEQKALDQSQGTARFESVPVIMSQFQTVQTKRGAGLNNINTNDSVYREHTEAVLPIKNADSFQALQTPTKKPDGQLFSNPSPDMTPNTKKLMLKLRSLPLKAKVLDEECDVPDLAQNMFDLNQNVDLAESVLVNSRTAGGNNPFGSFKPGSPGVDPRWSANNNQWQAQQVSEQLETLAAETLKIIEEIRSKKKKIEPRPSDVEEAQKKATSLNIHKMPVKDKKGNYVLFGHQNWNLVLNMMLGIQMAVKSVVEKEGDLSNKDFNVKYIFELVPKRTSETKISYKICTFFDYAPAIFYELRRLYGIRNEEYLRSIGPETMLGNLIKGNITSLSELTSTGKSGSFFYYSSDGKYTLKTISKDEFHFLRQILKNYYTHIINNPQSLIIKFFGLHKIRFMKKNGAREKVYFIIMANVFHTFKEIHVRYDLKGSTKGRYTKESDPSVAKKDLNIILSKEKIQLPPDIGASFVDIVEKDSRFFEENGIIDYSLLMGVHFLSQKEINAREGTAQRKQFYESSIHGREGVPSLDNTKLYFFGIIDILTHFNTKKKAEYVVKRIAYGKGISAVPPRSYADRFRKFIKSLVKTQA